MKGISGTLAVVLTALGIKATFNCFPENTVVGTEHGLRPIQDVRAEDRVWAFDHVAGEWKLCRVLETYCHDHDGDLVAATVAGEVIESTGHHPWWVVRGNDLKDRPQPDHVPFNPKGYAGNGRWIDAIDLRVGDVLLLRTGEQAAITELVIRHAQLPVYNFQVEELHCYAVGHAQILVHNNSLKSLDEAADLLHKGQVKEKDLRKAGLSSEDIKFVKQKAKESRPRKHDDAKIIDDITGSEKAVQNALEKVKHNPADASALKELQEATDQLDSIKKAQDELRRRRCEGN